MAEDILDEEIGGKNKSIVDHLQAPRKKKKNYAVLAMGKDMDEALLQKIEYYLKLNYATISVVRAVDAKEFTKLYSRQIVLLLISDGFLPLDQKIEMIKRFKGKNEVSGMPVLFFTNNPDELSKVYIEKLRTYQEIDQYVLWQRRSEQHILSLIGSMLSDGASRRRSRRFPADLPVKYHDLRSQKIFDGKLVDLSMHGGLLEKEESSPLFREKDQLQITLKVAPFLDLRRGQTLKLSARVRQTKIGGQKAGISWEYMTEDKKTLLMTYILKFTDRHMQDEAWLKRAEAQYRKKSK